MRAHRLFPLLMIASLLLPLGCGGDDADPCLGLELCGTAGQTRCGGEGVQTCSEDTAGCLVWADETPCGENQVCDNSGAEAACVCEDTCETQGELRCAGHFVQSCTADGDGCLFWSDVTDCSELEQACVGGECVSAENCSDGETRCSNNRVQTCAANTWSTTRDCTTSYQHCETTDGVAVCEGCGEGHMRCKDDDTTIQTCVDDAWADTTDCSASSQTCLDGACVD